MPRTWFVSSACALALSLLCACPADPLPPAPAPVSSGLPGELRPPEAGASTGASIGQPPSGAGLPDSLKPPR